MAKRATPEPKATTIEGLALLVQHEFAAMRTDLGEFREDMQGRLSGMDNRIDALHQEVAGLKEDFRRNTRETAVTLHDHETRLARVEKHA